MVKVPLRVAGAGLAITVNPIVPAPVPDWPKLTVIHGTLLTEVQAHPGGAVMLITGELAPAAGNDAEV
jgi:hypothetical protein